MRRYHKTILAIYLLLFFVSLFVSFQSPLAPYAKGIPWIDSSVFIHTAISILHGDVLYRDVFDNKGPFLYLINVLGLSISNGNGFWGIWLLQLFALFTTALFLYKTSTLFYNKTISLIAVCILIVFQSCFDYGGNITESWAVPMMSVALYIFAQYFATGKQLSWAQLFVLSTTFTLTFLLRANLVLMWGIFGIAVIVDLLHTKRYADAGRYAMIVMGFIIVTLIPYFLYFYSNHSIAEALYGMLWLNFKYTSAIDIPGIISLFFGFIRYEFVAVTIVLFSFAVICKQDKHDKKLFKWAVTVSIIMTLISCCVGRPNIHYLTQIIPLLLIPIGYCCGYLYDHLSSNKMIVTAIVAFSLTVPVFFSAGARLVKNYMTQSIVTSEENVFDLIIKNTGTDDKILVIGNSSHYYLFPDRMSSSKYPYCYPIIEKDAKIEAEYYSELINKQPRLIVVDFFWEALDVRSCFLALLAIWGRA